METNNEQQTYLFTDIEGCVTFTKQDRTTLSTKTVTHVGAQVELKTPFAQERYLVVLDYDTDEGIDYPVFGDNQLRIETPSGGVHLYYWTTEKHKAAQSLRPHVDLLTDYDRFPIDSDVEEPWPAKHGAYRRTGNVIYRLPTEWEELAQANDTRTPSDASGETVNMPDLIEPLDVEGSLLVDPAVIDRDWSETGGRNTALYQATLSAFRRANGTPEQRMGKALCVIEPYVDECSKYSEKARYWSIEQFWLNNRGLSKALTDKQTVAGVEAVEASERGRAVTGAKTVEGVEASERGRALLDDLVAFNKRFIYHTDESIHSTIALWLIHTYTLDKFNRTPRLYIHAPEPDCGKTTQGEIINKLCKDGTMVGSITPAALFRKIEKSRPTVIIDEAESLWSKMRQNEEMKAVVDQGYSRSGKVTRCDANTFEPTDFSVYSALAIIGVDNRSVPDTVLTRSIPIQMTRGNGDLEDWDEFEYEEEIEALKGRITLFAQSIESVKKIDIGLTNRRKQIWTPLLAIAEQAGGDWPERARRAAFGLRWEDRESDNTKVLKLTREFFTQSGKDWVTAGDLLRHINDSGMSSWNYSQMDLYNTLAAYSVKSRKTGGYAKYFRHDLEAAWEQWLGVPTPSQASTASTASTGLDASGAVGGKADPSATQSMGVVGEHSKRKWYEEPKETNEEGVTIW